MNVLIDVGHELLLEEVCNYFDKLKYKCLYDREVYCGLRIKVPCNDFVCTVLAFPSGKVLLTGLKTSDCIETIYKNVVVFL